MSDAKPWTEEEEAHVRAVLLAAEDGCLSTVGWSTVGVAMPGALATLDAARAEAPRPRS